MLLGSRENSGHIAQDGVFLYGMRRIGQMT